MSEARPVVGISPLRFLQMSCFHIIVQTQIQAWSLQCSKLFFVTLQWAPLNCAPGAESAIVNCIVFFGIAEDHIKWIYGSE